MTIEGWNFLDSIYMTIITLSTVGYGEVRHIGPAGRIFTILLILFGISIMAYMINARTSFTAFSAKTSFTLLFDNQLATRFNNMNTHLFKEVFMSAQS